MNALHIRTTGFYCKACPLVVEKAVGSMPGVADVVAVRSMRLTSVLYDPSVTDAETLCSRIRAAGFGASVYHTGETDSLLEIGESRPCSQCEAGPSEDSERPASVVHRRSQM